MAIPWNIGTEERLTDGEIELVVERSIVAQPAKGWVAGYRFKICPLGGDTRLGEIDVRLGYTENIVRYAGHIGYGVVEEQRGHRYAAKACMLVRQIFIERGMDVIWITCNPDNAASRRTCEIVGATLVEIVDLPIDNDMYRDGDRQKCRYRWVLI